MNKKDVEDIFNKWPEIESFYVCSDGAPFIRPQEAVSHSKDLDNKEIAEFNRDELAYEAE